MAQENYKASLEMFLKNKKLTIVLFSVLLTVILLIIFFTFFKKEKEKIILPKEEKKEEIQVSAVETFVPEVIFSLTGVITDIDKDIVTFNASVPYFNSEGKRANISETRKASIDESTKIFRYLVTKNKQTGKSEITEETLKISNLKIGDEIEVVSGKDIKYKKEFLAIKIRILQN